MMSKLKRSCLPPLLVFVVFLFGAFLVVLVGAVFILPNRASQTFGRPTPNLSTNQLVRLSAQLLWQANDLTSPIDPLGEDRQFQISLGESVPSIANRLQAEGLIWDAGVFRAYLQYTGLDISLQAGTYTLSPGMTAVEIAQSFQDATPSEVTLVVLEGWRMEEIAESLPTTGLEVSPKSFLEAASNHPAGYPFLEDLPSQSTLEGFFFPGSYQVSRNLSATKIVSLLLDNFKAQLTPKIQRGFSNQGLSVFEAVSLASIVQREAVSEEEMPLIASVFFNRLAAGMKLEADSTVQYALGYNSEHKTWWTNPLSRQDLQIDSPYNSYLYPGLPPGPIDNPSLRALRAVAFPAQTPYYYFRAACDGSGKHTFAETFEEHVGNECP
jgi:UPF0755 protein